MLVFIAASIALIQVALSKEAWPVREDGAGNYEPASEWELTQLEEGDYFEGDIVLQKHENPLDIENFSARRGAQYRWPGGQIPFVISTSYNEFEREVIWMAQQNYARYTCIRWIPRTNQSNYINIFSGSGCYSSVGNERRGAQDLSLQRPGLGGTCIVQGIAQHEMMHASGFYHEQSRTDRDDYVTVYWNNIRTGKANNFLKYGVNGVSMEGIRYDYSSIMHYGNLSFSKNPSGNLYTMLPKTPGVTIGQRRGFSAKDVLKLNKYYSCTPPLNPPAPIDNGSNPRACSFDADWCGWTQDYTIDLSGNAPSRYDDDFDWMRLSIPTPSKNTGPAQDHTSGTGKYLYIEASSPRVLGDVARIRSPWIPANHGQLCISFWYNMFSTAGLGGSADPMGSIRVYVLESKANATRSLVWTKAGTQSTSPYQWIRAQIPYTPSQPQGNVRVLFEGVVGTSYQGDAAFDDFYVSDGSCSSVTPPLGDPLDCTFEPGTCGYSPDANSMFNWGYQTRSMGPVTAMYGSSFMGIPFCYPAQFAQNAKLVGPTITLPKAQGKNTCVSFYYNLQGTLDGAIKLSIRTGSTDNFWWRFEVNTTPNQPWVMATVNRTLPHGLPIQVVFEATRGLGPNCGYMAIDNVRVQNC